MRNAKTKQVLDYWLALRRDGRVPARRDIDPSALRQVLPYVFLADAVSPDVTAIRLAGTGLCERYGRELRNHNLQTMWSPSDRVAMRGLIVNVIKKPAPGLAMFRAETIDRRSIACEMLLLPLHDLEGRVTKLLGSTFATEATTHLGNRPLVYQRLEKSQILLIGEQDPEVLAPAVNGEDMPIAQPIRAKGHLKLVVSQDLPDLPAPGVPRESTSRV